MADEMLQVSLIRPRKLGVFCNWKTLVGEPGGPSQRPPGELLRTRSLWLNDIDMLCLPLKTWSPLAVYIFSSKIGQQAPSETMLFSKLPLIGSVIGASLRMLADTGFQRPWGTMLPGKGSRIVCPFEVRVVAGSKIWPNWTVRP